MFIPSSACRPHVFVAVLAQVALLGKVSKSTKVKEIATMGANLVVAAKSDTVQECMSKMVDRDIRHLPVVDDETGTVSVRYHRAVSRYRITVGVGRMST